MYWIKKEGDKAVVKLITKDNSEIFYCGPEWDVQDVYYNELNPNKITVTFKKKDDCKKGTRYPCHDCEHVKTCEWSFTDQMYSCGGKEMSKKYIIELEDKVSENAKGESLYFVKGFNNLSLDETALKKLTPYEEPEHEFQVGDVVRNGVLTGVIIDFYNEDTAVVLCSCDKILKPIYMSIESLAYLNRNINSKLVRLKGEIHAR